MVAGDRLKRNSKFNTRSGFSKENRVFGQSRTASTESNITSQIGSSNVFIYRGNGQQYGFSGYPPDTYNPYLTNNSATTILYDQPNNQFIEYFPSGARCYYKNQGETSSTGYVKHDLYAAETPAGNVFTYIYGTGAEVGLVKAIQSPTDQRVSFAYTASATTSLINSVTDWGGRVWTYQFDANNNLTTLTTPLGCQTKYTYVPGGWQNSGPNKHGPTYGSGTLAYEEIMDCANCIDSWNRYVPGAPGESCPLKQAYEDCTQEFYTKKGPRRGIKW